MSTSANRWVSADGGRHSVTVSVALGAGPHQVLRRKMVSRPKEGHAREAETCGYAWSGNCQGEMGLGYGRHQVRSLVIFLLTDSVPGARGCCLRAVVLLGLELVWKRGTLWRNSQREEKMETL